MRILIIVRLFRVQNINRHETDIKQIIMPFKKNNQHGKRFSKTYRPRITGRRPSIYKQVAKQVDKEMKLYLSRDDYSKIQQWVIERKVSELIEMLDEPRIPAFLTILIKSVLSDIKSGKTENLDKIYDRIFGRSTISIVPNIDLSHPIKFEKLTDDEFNTLIDIIQKIR